MSKLLGIHLSYFLKKPNTIKQFKYKMCLKKERSVYKYNTQKKWNTSNTKSLNKQKDLATKDLN
jgi:hypothetical protein